MSDIIIIKILYCTIIMQLKFTLGLHTWIETSVKNSLWQSHPWRLVYIYIVRPQGSCTYIKGSYSLHHRSGCEWVPQEGVKKMLYDSDMYASQFQLQHYVCPCTHACPSVGWCMPNSKCTYIYNIVKLYSDYNYTFYLIFYNYPEI